MVWAVIETSRRDTDTESVQYTRTAAVQAE